MTSTEITIPVKMREAASHITLRVQMKGALRFKIGLWILRVGCWFTGAQLVDEFPMSLIQPDELKIVKHR